MPPLTADHGPLYWLIEAVGDLVKTELTNSTLLSQTTEFNLILGKCWLFITHVCNDYADL